MTPPATGMVLGVGAAAALGWPAARPGAGWVIASFSRAAYVRFPGGLAALTEAGVPAGPLHIHAPVRPGALVPGEAFVLRDEWLEAATVWEGRIPDRPPGDEDVLRSLAALARRSPLLQPPLARRWRAATAAADLGEVCRLLGGLGPGLTPSGDDALAGILLGARTRNPRSERRLVAVAGTVRTHEISRAFLAWAARGQSIEPVHRLLGGDPSGVRELEAYGHFSGADLALGLRYGLTGQCR